MSADICDRLSQSDLSSSSQTCHSSQSSRDERQHAVHIHPSSSLVTVSTVVTTGRSRGRRHILKHFFTRQSEAYESATTSRSTDSPPLPNDLESVTYVPVGPSPHTHPLLSKPVARDETIQGQLKVAISKGAPASARTPRLNEVRSDYEPGHVYDPHATSASPCASSYTDCLTSPTSREIYTAVLRERERTAMFSASETRYVREWSLYLKNYAEVVPVRSVI